jgi:predicted lipoprotein with Yx(FWY)xxD motif
MKTLIYTKLLFTVIGTVLLGLWGCSKGKDPVKEEETKTPGIAVREHGTYGTIITDADGNALYFFSNDSKGASTCIDGCLITWPVYHNTGSIDAKLSSSDFGEITRADGTKQTTYKGWPLYYNAGDGKANDVKGDGINQIWYVAKPDYLLMVAHAQLVGADGKSYKPDYSEGEGIVLYFTDGNGRTLYAFAPDKFNKNTFTLSDFSNDPVWPIYQLTTGELPSIISKDDIGQIDVFGKKQLTYKGWPLYYFGQDTQRGDNKGVSFPRPAVWPIVNTTTPVAPAE